MYIIFLIWQCPDIKSKSNKCISQNIPKVSDFELKLKIFWCFFLKNTRQDLCKLNNVTTLNFETFPVKNSCLNLVTKTQGITILVLTY